MEVIYDTFYQAFGILDGIIGGTEVSLTCKRISNVHGRKLGSIVGWRGTRRSILFGMYWMRIAYVERLIVDPKIFMSVNF